jgi:hypothetical protein
VTVSLESDDGGVVRSFDGDVTITLGGGPKNKGKLQGTTTRRAAGGVAVFPDLRVTRKGKNYTLTATAKGYKAVTSGKFDVKG